MTTFDCCFNGGIERKKAPEGFPSQRWSEPSLQVLSWIQHRWKQHYVPESVQVGPLMGATEILALAHWCWWCVSGALRVWIQWLLRYPVVALPVITALICDEKGEKLLPQSKLSHCPDSPHCSPGGFNWRVNIKALPQLQAGQAHLKNNKKRLSKAA